MNHVGTREVQTDRLLLRRFTLEDAPAMYRNWASDPEVTKFLTWPAHDSVGVSRKVLSDWVRAYDNPDFYQWAIVLNANGPEPLGCIGAVHQQEDIGMARIGYCLGRDFWRQGIMSEALDAVIRYFFEQAGANRLESRHDPRNPHSGGVMKKCGMLYEGTMRQSDRNNQGLCDACYYAILRSDRSGSPK